MKERQKYYSSRLVKLEVHTRHMQKQIRLISVLRLLVFLLIIISIFVIIPRLLVPGIAIGALSLFLFLYLIKLYLRKRAKLEHGKALIEINKNELLALNFNYSCFDLGEEFIDHEHSFSYDMDLFGVGSVFQFINRTVSIGGKQKLADLLRTETTKAKEIIDRQEAIKELSTQIERTQNFRASGELFPESPEDMEQLSAWLKQTISVSKKKMVRILIMIMPFIFVAFALLSVYFPLFRSLTGLLFLGNLFAVSRKYSKTNLEHNLISKRLDVLKKFSHLLHEIEGGSYNSAVLKEIHLNLLTAKFSAGNSIRELTKIVSSFDSRLNVIAAIFLEGIFLWDFRCLLRLEAWKEAKGSHFESWIESIAGYDSLVSLANYSFNNPDFVYPVIGSKIIQTENLGHILIHEDERVPNNFTIENRGDFVIVTGANMAGKSTFLRTVATNLILAMCGAPVCASSFSFKPTKLFSSMRTSDSLTKHESYFYAELKRLKDLLDKMRAGKELFIILDEILKGTNSIDKQRGSYAALEQIVKYSGTGIIATHDLELAKIENQFPERIKNMCFEVEIDRAKISFDYKLLPGITTKMNASLLMEQMGIIEKKK